MKTNRLITTVDAHIGGEVSRVITGGVIDLPGKTMAEKLHHVNAVDDSLRRFVLHEPRGGVDKTTNIVVPPTRDDADVGFFPMEANGCYPMSGANAICVVTALLETGTLPMQEPETLVRLDTAAGLVDVRVQCREGSAIACSVETPASFPVHLDHPLEVEGVGTLTTDVGWGGWFYGFVDARELGFSIRPDEARDIAQVLRKIGAALWEQVDIRHPYDDSINKIDLGAFPFLTLDPEEGSNVHRFANMMPGGRVDRSPCGTGAAARAAVLHAKGKMKLGEEHIALSITDGEFKMRLLEKKIISGTEVVMPEITGRAFIYGTSQLFVNPEDPYQMGISLSDMWGEAAKGC
ncbi:MAG: proline racemase [Rhodobacteraceae bacterium]|nr:proline racemase [Paracoccaceae bacterium]